MRNIQNSVHFLPFYICIFSIYPTSLTLFPDQL